MGWNGLIHTCTLEDREQDVKLILNRAWALRELL